MNKMSRKGALLASVLALAVPAAGPASAAFERLTRLGEMAPMHAYDPQPVYGLQDAIQMAGLPGNVRFDEDGNPILTEDGYAKPEPKPAHDGNDGNDGNDGDAGVDPVGETAGVKGAADTAGDPTDAVADSDSGSGGDDPMAEQTVDELPLEGAMPPENWRADAGQTVQATLETWAGMAGWTVVWNSEHQYVLQASATFEGGFEDASSDLIAAFARANPPIAGKLYGGNKVLVVETPSAYAHQ